VHGLAGHEGAVTIRVEASVSGETLTLRVLTRSHRAGAPGGGIGLANVREAPGVQFGERATFCGGPPLNDNIGGRRFTCPLLRDGPKVQRSLTRLRRCDGGDDVDDEPVAPL